MAPANPSGLKLRIASALILAPLALGAVWAGGVYFIALVLVAVLGMAWEWARLTGRGRLRPSGVVIIATPPAAVAAMAFEPSASLALSTALAGSLAVALIAATTRQAEAGWAAAGALWISLGSVAFLAVWMIAGREFTLWLLAVVWISDIAAYAVGRSVGGPRLAPRISPNKSWAGFLGGFIGPALLGGALAPLLGGQLGFYAALAAALGLAAQMGDLAESFAKRHFGVKDSSGLIPGHGGLLDRLDGLLTAAAAFLAAILVLPYF